MSAGSNSTVVTIIRNNMMRSTTNSSAVSSKCTKEEEMNPIMCTMEEERIESLAPASAMCRFSPCRPDVAVVGNAFDLILLQSSVFPLTASCSDSMYSFGIHALSPMLCTGKDATGAVTTVLEITQMHGEPIQFPIRHQKIQAPAHEQCQHHHMFMEERGKDKGTDNRTYDSHPPITNAPSLETATLTSTTATATTSTSTSTSTSRADDPHRQTQLPDLDLDLDHDAKTLGKLTSFLKKGCNAARYLLQNADGETIAIAPFNIFLWSCTDRIMVVDVDGTITRSNIRGVVDTIVTEQYTYCHDGVCEFLSSSSSLLRNMSSSENGENDSKNNGGDGDDEGDSSQSHIRLLYLTSRPIGIANTTRKFLSQLRQRDTHQLPQGPLIGHTGTLPQVLMMELVYKSIHEFKAAALLQHVVQPFAVMGVHPRNIFVAGFGNTLMDMQAYHMAGMDLGQIYLIDKQSNIYCLDQASKTLSDKDTDDDDDANDSNTSKNNKDNNKQDHPKPRNEYLRMRGTHFMGYLDERLLDHVLDR